MVKIDPKATLDKYFFYFRSGKLLLWDKSKPTAASMLCYYKLKNDLVYMINLERSRTRRLPSYSLKL